MIQTLRMTLVAFSILTLAGFAQANSCTTAETITVVGNAKVDFGGSVGYTPRCLKIKAGSTVTLPGSSRHPLSPIPTENGPANPLEGTSHESNVVVTYNNAGVYGYFCERHGSVSGNGMAGFVIVE